MGNKLTYNGKEYWWDGRGESEDKLMTASAHICASLIAEELGVDTLRAVVRDYDLQSRVLTTGGLPLVAGGRLLVTRRTDLGLDKAYLYGAEVPYYHNDKLVGKFRLEEIKRTGRYQYALSCISAIGLLLTSDHYGGIYTGQTVAEVIADIIGGVIRYTLDAALGAVPLYGLLRKRSRRDNLRDVLFVAGGQIRKTTAGEVDIIPMTAGTPYAISVDEFYMGGSVTGGKSATGVNVTEHSFVALPSDDLVTLYDGAAAAEELVTPKGKTVTGVLVDFQEPMHSLSIQNAEILESGANYAVISNSPAAVLTGKQYTHTTRVVSRRQNTGGAPNIVNSSACELVNLLNSELVADRIMAYYGAGKTVEADLVVSGQKPGDAVTFADPFGDATTGYIADMELTMSAILKAATTLIAGYIPTASGNYYANMMVITSSQSITIPAEAKDRVLVVAIGGGDGGGLGQPGEAGGKATASSYGNAGEGGLPGIPGVGGKIYVGTVKIKPGQVIPVAIGPGGKGATRDSEATKGGATTFGNLISSDNGYASPDGYTALISGEVYALPGKEGIPGGRGESDGEPGESIEYNGVTYVPGESGADDDEDGYIARGGLGGGPAAGVNGGDGEDGNSHKNPDGSHYSNGGDGGKGATPVKAENGSVPGQGGQAGHGGGGGGGGGAARGSDASYQWQGSGGPGGLAGEAGDGAAGILIMFY